MSVVFIYGLKCPLTDDVRYIGRSVDPFKRFQGHLQSKQRTHCANWIRKLVDMGLKPRLVLFEIVEDGDNWADAEKSWISLARSLDWPITNIALGGEGVDSETLIEIWKNPSFREKRLNSMRIAQSTTEYKVKHKKAMEEVRNRPEYDEFRKIVSQRSSKMWENEEYRERQLNNLNSPERLKIKSEYMVTKWAENKDFRQAMDCNRWNEESRDKQKQLILTDERQDKIKKSLTSDVIKKRNASIKANWIRKRKEIILDGKSKGRIPFKGVVEALDNKGRGKSVYTAKIRIEGITVNLGTYKTTQEAGWAYEFVAKALYEYYCSLDAPDLAA